MIMTLKRVTRAARGLGLAGALALAAVAQAPAHAATDFPTKPVRLIVPYSPGGSTDVIARLLAREMARHLGQQVVVENRDGASGTIAATHVAKSPADGYTVCYCTTGPLVIVPMIDSKLAYKPDRDLTAVTHVLNQPFVVVVRSTLGIENFKDFIAMAKANPGKISFGSPGTATPSHLTGELLKIATGIDIRHVPYRGDTPAVQDMLGGHIDAMMLSAVSVKPLVEAGKIKALAVSSSTRLKTSLPDVPTIDELGYPGFQTNNLHALYAPAGTPADVIAKLNSAAVAALRTPEAIEKISGQGLIIVGDSPADTTRSMQQEAVRWTPVINKLDLQQQR
ncbi:MAG: tripartite tricarboxylate transporter substrate binding protein [Burkholderiales bacterium]|nr:tripartite tricarboxylate transporter substrate binding protein [Burkholderiales bacterium]